jgi:hypothetical protein
LRAGKNNEKLIVIKNTIQNSYQQSAESERRVQLNATTGLSVDRLSIRLNADPR